MTDGTAPKSTPVDGKMADGPDELLARDLERYGIVARRHTSYEWNGYRYSNSSDAIAAAKRAAR